MLFLKNQPIAPMRPQGSLDQSAFQAATMARARAAISAAETAGRYSAEPIPKPDAPASAHGLKLAALMPPTTKMGMDAGITASCARSTAGVAASAGNSLRACAPASMAANASVAVA